MKENTAQAKGVRPWLETMASPSIVFFTLPWLMMLLVMGTVAQRDLGLYDAQKLFFSSWILWLGPVPLPGAFPTLGLLTLGLLAKFLLYSPWRAHQAGIILTHLGVLVLLIGGLVTSLSQQEGYLMLKEGDSAASVSDYHQRVLRIERDGDEFAVMPFEKIDAQSLKDFGLPFEIGIETLCRNCRPVMNDKPEGRQGFAQKVTLVPIDADKNDEANMSGIIFTVKGADQGQDGTWLAVEEIPMHPEIEASGSVYSFVMGRAQTELPFSIELKDFKREMHPGTEMARGFSSDVIVHDGGVAWPYHIRMNEPLRYKGYTFYQASFSMRPDGEFSILSVVRNKGRIFPYIASAIIFAGLLLHSIIRLRGAKGGKA